MLTLFISYHPSESQVLAQLLEWLEPLRYKYFLRIYYNRYDPKDEENVAEYTEALYNAHLYIYLTSQTWLRDRNIQTKEVDAIIDRRYALGKDFIHMLPVQVRPCQWRNFSKLVEVEDATLPHPKKEIGAYQPIDEAYNLIIAKLTDIIAGKPQAGKPGLRQRLIEDAKLRGLPIEGFHSFHYTPKEKAPRKGTVRFTLEDVRRWLLIGVLLFLIWCLYTLGCNAEPYR